MEKVIGKKLISARTRYKNGAEHLTLTFQDEDGNKISVTIVGKSNSLEDIRKLAQNKWDEHGGLFILIDSETGEETSWGS